VARSKRLTNESIFENALAVPGSGSANKSANIKGILLPYKFFEGKNLVADFSYLKARTKNFSLHPSHRPSAPN